MAGLTCATCYCAVQLTSQPQLEHCVSYHVSYFLFLCLYFSIFLSLSHVQSQVENEELREELSAVSAQYSSVLEENQRLRAKLENLEQVLKVNLSGWQVRSEGCEFKS